MVKKSFGVSLDELGIGLINIGSVAFEYIASIFSDDRLQRRCAIVTDLDTYVEEAGKSSEKACKLGLSRKQKLNELFADNVWVDIFLADYTFEIDLALERRNHYCLKKFSEFYYKYESKQDYFSNALDSGLPILYDAVLKPVETMGKGWFATVLSTMIDEDISIPEYIVAALAFASQDVITVKILKKIFNYVLKNKNIKDSRIEMDTDSSNALTVIEEYCGKYPEWTFSKYYVHIKRYRKW